MASCRKVYDLAGAKKLIPILGVEGYVRDDDCPILAAHGIVKPTGDEKDSGTYRGYNKYYHITLHALDQKAYERLVLQLSLADARAEVHGSERKPLFTWAQLEDLGTYNIIATSGCLVGVVQRHLMSGRPDIAGAYYKRIREIFKPGNFYVELFSHRCDKNWVDAIFLTLEGGETLKYYTGKTLRTDAGEFKASEIAKSPTKHKKLLAVKNYHTWEEREPKAITSVRAVQDYIANECSPWAPDGDVQLGANKFMLAMTKRFHDPILISDDAHFADMEDKIVQDCKLGGKGGSWKFYGSYHRQSSQEAFQYFNKYMNISEETFRGWLDQHAEWSDRFKDFAPKESNPNAAGPWEVKPSLPTSFYPADTLKHTRELIAKHGRMDWQNKAMVDRLQSEIELLHFNGTIDLLPYFFIDEEICSLYRTKGLLTGPGRGSAAGLLLTFLLGITHVDPLKYGLSQDRFLTLDRIKTGKLPDIDQDLPDTSILVDPVNGYLRERFGECYAQISVDTTVKLKSAIKDICRARRGTVLAEIHEVCNQLPNPPQGIDDKKFVFGYLGDDGKEVKGLFDTNEALQQYAKSFPEDWRIVQKMMGITRQKGRHACYTGETLISTVEGDRVTATRIDACQEKTVLTGQGNRAQAKLLFQGQRRVVEYTLENGEKIQATPDHVMLTTDGWLAIQEAYEKGADLVCPLVPAIP